MNLLLRISKVLRRKIERIFGIGKCASLEETVSVGMTLTWQSQCEFKSDLQATNTGTQKLRDNTHIKYFE